MSSSYQAVQYGQEPIDFSIKHWVALKPGSSAAPDPDWSLALEAFSLGEMWGKV